MSAWNIIAKSYVDFQVRICPSRLHNNDVAQQRRPSHQHKRQERGIAEGDDRVPVNIHALGGNVWYAALCVGVAFCPTLQDLVCVLSSTLRIVLARKKPSLQVQEDKLHVQGSNVAIPGWISSNSSRVTQGPSADGITLVPNLGREGKTRLRQVRDELGPAPRSGLSPQGHDVRYFGGIVVRRPRRGLACAVGMTPADC
eukprot:1729741-Rhodomonas_salina.3